MERECSRFIQECGRRRVIERDIGEEGPPSFRLLSFAVSPDVGLVATLVVVTEG